MAEAARDAPDRAGDSPDAPRLPQRRFSVGRRAAVRAVETALRLGGGRRFYRRAFLAAGRFRVRRERVRVPDLPAGLVGLRIAHLSDLHAGPFLGAGALGDVISAIEAAGARVVCVTGDLITHRWEESLALVPDLARLSALRSVEHVLGVFGNHDYRGRHEGRIAAAFASAGVRMLRNECVRLDTGRGAAAFVGVEDLEEARSIDVAAARAGVRAGDVEIVLCHNPGGAARLARPGCAAVLSGHSHGHQIDLPLIRRAAPAHPGDRVDRGETACITSRGIGALGVPLRIRARAEVVLIELEPAEPSARASVAPGGGRVA
jgi:hypothetical protein